MLRSCESSKAAHTKKMPNTCEVCASEPSKYRCPTCGLLSCSLACTQSHKIYCAPKEPSSKTSEEVNGTGNQPEEVNGHTGENTHESQNDTDPRALGSSPQLKELFDRYPALRDQLRDIYKATLEEEWVETQVHGGRRPFGRGKGAPRSRGPWTREKGFNRGLGKVRKLREMCEEGSEVGKNAEGYMRFVALVNGERFPQESA
ncbi:HIT zinc finger [Aspergillus parasiticus SU-1]|uniref:HIT zinc finger n=1 Tax=Aspergillus parasiticus (strain ATCC 56775 / NRRL 5862 / SRRC 143 / SU-1) TaxID=1403190 RepID=A0A0F0IHH8_ASPPU|nr:HIT zinc finger [Aspergillus parasiticus SU-1]